MSTKATVTHGPGFHLYSECFEENPSLYLDLDAQDDSPEGDPWFECSPGNVVIRIPARVLRAILAAAEGVEKEISRQEDWRRTRNDPEKMKAREEEMRSLLDAAKKAPDVTE